MDDFFRLIQLGISSTTLIILITSSFKIGKWTQKKDSDISNLINNHEALKNRLDIIDNKVDLINEELGDIRTDVAIINTKCGIVRKQERQEEERT